MTAILVEVDDLREGDKLTHTGAVVLDVLVCQTTGHTDVLYEKDDRVASRLFPVGTTIMVSR